MSTIGLNYWPFLARRRDSQEPLRRYERFELGKAIPKIAAWPYQTQAVYYTIVERRQVVGAYEHHGLQSNDWCP